jgi:hypothetical protein
MTSLWELRRWWEDFYRVESTGDVWSATLLADPAEVLTADTAMELRTKMQDHHSAWSGRRTAGGCST